MRPANTFVTEMSKFSSEVDIVFGGKRINGKSIMTIRAVFNEQRWYKRCEM